MQFCPCAVFIDGEYWGLYFLTEKYGKEYISKNYGIEEDNVIMIKNNTLEEGKWEDFEGYQSGKWRQMLFDVNSGTMGGAETDSFRYVIEEGDLIFANLMANDEFKKQFWDRFKTISIDGMKDYNRAQVLKTYDRFYGGKYGEKD